MPERPVWRASGKAASASNPHSAACIGLQHLAQWCQGEAVQPVAREEAERRRRTQQAVHGALRQARRRGELLRSAAAGLHVLGDPVPHQDLDHPRHQHAVGQLEELDGQRDLRDRGCSGAGHAGLASTMLTGDAVGTTRSSRNPASIEELGVLRLRPLHAVAVDDEHDHVEHLARVWVVTGRDHHLDDEQPAVGVHRLAAVVEDPQTALLRPVVHARATAGTRRRRAGPRRRRRRRPPPSAPRRARASACRARRPTAGRRARP